MFIVYYIIYGCKINSGTIEDDVLKR